MRRKILQFLAIKLSKETHKKFSAVVAKIGWLAFAGLMIVGVYNTTADYFEASGNLDNGVAIQTQISLADTTFERSKRGERAFYHYTYGYSVDGQDHVGEFRVNENANRNYGEGKTIDVVYRQDDPAVSARLDNLTKTASVGAVIKRFFLLIFVAGISMLLFYYVITDVLVIQKKSA